jgi:hypothetical protein
VINYSDPNYARLVAEIAGAIHAERFAEIGVYRCHLVKKVLKSKAGNGIKQYVAVDHWINKRPNRQFKSEEQYQHALDLKKWFPMLEVVRKASVEASSLFQDGHFDLVFIDADHGYKPVLNDILAWGPKVRSGGVLCGHDFFAGDGPSRHPGVAKAVRKLFSDDVLVTPSTVWLKVMP